MEKEISELIKDSPVMRVEFYGDFNEVLINGVPHRAGKDFVERLDLKVGVPAKVALVKISG